MERKIGEIFEYNGEWHQCLEEKTCTCFGCDFRDYNCDDISLKEIKGSCQSERRNDNKSVIFKKLEKVEEPYILEDKKFQKYKVFKTPYIYHKIDCSWQSFADPYCISLEIKQNKEDMEENKTTPPKEDNALTRIIYAYVNGKISDKELIRSIKEMSDEYPYNKNNLTPFSLELAKQGKLVCTRDGRKARIVCFDRIDAKPILALILSTDGKGEEVFDYFVSGKRLANALESDLDLMMYPEKKEGWVNIYRDCDGANITENDNIYSSEEDAIASAQIINKDGYIATAKITWEE